MDQTLEKLMNLKGIEDLKAVIEKWDNLSKALPRISSNKPVLLPDMLWVSDSGNNINKILYHVSEFLYDRDNLMEFYGDVKYFQYCLKYCPPQRQFVETHDFMEHLENAAGFRSAYKGIVFIDISKWKGHFKETYFIDFLKYLSENSDPWLIILNVCDIKGEARKELESILTMFLRMEIVTLDAPSSSALFEYACDYLGDYGITLGDTAAALVQKTIAKLSESQYFEGYKSVTRLCQDIVYDLCSKEADLSVEIGADLLKEFDEDSKYIAARIVNYKQKRKIGLVSGGRTDAEK